jgi:hypothetical protein
MKQESNNQLLSPHFELSEFIESPTARKHGIDNTPPPEAVENLKRLCQGNLEPLREELGLPVVITSGFRTKALNNLLAHSSERSQHMQGQAADFYVAEPKDLNLESGTLNPAKPTRRELLIKAFRLIIQSEQIDYDQLILYPTFIHVSYVSRERNRHTILLGNHVGKLGNGKCSVQNALRINS